VKINGHTANAVIDMNSRYLRSMAVCASAVMTAGTFACRTVVSAEGEVPDPNTPASLELVADGGIAAFHTVAHVDSASGNVYWQSGQMCAPSAGCPVVDPLSGRLDPKVVDAFYERAATSEFRSLRADYGTTKNGADMRLYTLTIHANGRVRTLRADDGTMPTLMAEFVNDVMSAVSEAVKR
jgi:hypothetical protein